MERVLELIIAALDTMDAQTENLEYVGDFEYCGDTKEGGDMQPSLAGFQLITTSALTDRVVDEGERCF